MILVHSLFAVAGHDFSTLVGFRTLFPLSNSLCTAINIVNDEALEVTESFAVSLSLAEDLSRVRLSHPMTTVFIADDDGEVYFF